MDPGSTAVYTQTVSLRVGCTQMVYNPGRNVFLCTHVFLVHGSMYHSGTGTLKVDVR